jgi:hypothetical protein
MTLCTEPQPSPRRTGWEVRSRASRDDRPRGVRSRALGVTLVGTAAMILTGACGASGSESESKPHDSSSSSTLDSEFLDRAEVVCAPYADYQHKTILQFNFNRYDPDPALLSQVADHLAQHPAYRTLVSDLEGLGAPASGATMWKAVLDDFRANARSVQAGIDAARAGDTAGFATFVDELGQEKTQLFKDLQNAGLGGGSCAGAEVDPLRSKELAD